MAADIPVCYAGSHAQATGGTTNVVTVGSDFAGSPAAFPVIAGETVIVCGGAGTHLPTGINDSQANGGYAQAAGTATSPASWIFASPAVAHPLHAAGTGFTADTVTVTYSGTVPGLTATPADSGSAATASGNSTAPSVTSGALAQAREFVVAVCVSAQAAGEAVWPAPWQVIAKGVQTGAGAFCSVAVLRNYTGTAAITASPTLPGIPGAWTMSICGFKGAASSLKSYVGATVSTSSFADSPGSWGAALEWDADMGRAPSAQRTRVFYISTEGQWGTTAADDPQGIATMVAAHPSMKPILSIKPKRMAVITPSVATSEIAAMCVYATMLRNNGVTELRWCLWNEMNNGGGTSSFGDGTAKGTQAGDPWAVGGPVPPPAGGWTGQQAGAHYRAYCNLFGPALLLTGYLVAYKPMIASYNAVQYNFPGRAWGTGAQANNAGGCNEIILDLYAWDPHQDLANKWITVTDQLARGVLTSFGGVDYSFTPEAALGFGEIGVTDGPNTPDDTDPGWTAALFNNVSAPSFGGHALPVPGVTQFFLNRIAGGHPSAPIVWFSEKPAPAGNAIDSTGAINSRQDIGDAWRALYDTLSVDAATTGVAPTVTTASLPAWQVGVPVSFQMQASGGTAPLVWSLSSGALPAGLILHASGLIDGTPTVAGTTTPHFLVTDAASLTGAATLTATVAGSQLTVPAQPLPGGVVGSPYAAQLGATGGTPPDTWAVLSGALPAGLSLSSAGLISGVPTTPGTASFTPQVTDHLGATASAPLQIVVTAAAFAITTAALPPGILGGSYAADLGTAGGTLPVTNWQIISGQLPPGLALAIPPAGDPNIGDEAGTGITDEAGTQITDESGP
jgi:hypothetical protein